MLKVTINFLNKIRYLGLLNYIPYFRSKFIRDSKGPNITRSVFFLENPFAKFTHKKINVAWGIAISNSRQIAATAATFYSHKKQQQKS